MAKSRWIEKWYVDSDSGPGKKYTVARDAAGEFGCSCPRWKFQRGGRVDCKHINDVKAALRQPHRGIVKVA